MLIDNRRILQNKNKILLEKLENHINTTCEIVSSKSGVNTLIVTKDFQQLSYHSRYNPIQEAKMILEKQIQANTEYVLLIGVGLGYIINQLVENYPNVRFSIYEPDLDVMNVFLSTFELKKIRSKNIDVIFSHPLELENSAKFYQSLTHKDAQIVIIPSVTQIYKDDIEQFMKVMKHHLESNKESVITDLRFQMRWTTNSIVNLREVLTTPNFFNDVNIKLLKDKPALIVAAGPSLDDEIENIRLIKEKGKAYIFAVGSAVNTLIKHHIMPDALFSYDPTAKNAEVVKKVKELQLNIPLIFGSSIGYEVLENYPGKKIHFLTSQDSITPNLVSEKSHIIPDAPTIAAIALYIIGGIGMGPIVLVGQNLSITKEKTYAAGIDYVDKQVLSEETLKTYQSVISTTGEEVYTQSGYISMKKVIEHYIKKVGLEGKIVNATKNGLPIVGAPFETLSNIIDNHLHANNLVESSIFEVENNYNIAETLNKFQQYEDNFDSLIDDFKKLVLVDTKIREAYDKKLINNVQNHFNEFDKYFNRIEKNQFFLQTLAPITRTQYKQLVDRSDTVRYEKRPLQKMEKYIDIYSKYIRTMYLGIVQIQPAFAELKKSDLFKKEDSQ